jgi:ligand-binding SRPBCC domain-containing protein
MADHVLESRVWVARPRPDVFAIVADPDQRAQLAPPALRLRLRTEGPVMGPGSVLDYDLRWFGLPVRWRTFMREWDPPFRFVDVQVWGPFARWEHRLQLLAGADATCVEDRITYRLPLGPLGRLLHAVAVRRRLEAAWAYRRARLTALGEPVTRPGA